MMVDMQVVLPAPLRPSSPSSRPARSENDDAVQHVAVAVEGVDAGDRERLVADQSPR